MQIVKLLHHCSFDDYAHYHILNIILLYCCKVVNYSSVTHYCYYKTAAVQNMFEFISSKSILITYVNADNATHGAKGFLQLFKGLYSSGHA